MSTTLILGVVLTIVVIVVAAQNTTEARLRFLWWHARSPLVVVILGTALSGVVLDEIAGLVWRRRRRRHLADREAARHHRERGD